MGEESKNRSGKRQRMPLYIYILTLLAPFVFTAFIWFPWGLSYVNNKTAEPRVCTVESAAVDVSSGGPKSATKHETVFIQTPDCGQIYISKLPDQFDSFEDLAQTLNEHRGQKATFQVGKLRLSSDSIRAENVSW